MECYNVKVTIMKKTINIVLKIDGRTAEVARGAANNGAAEGGAAEDGAAEDGAAKGGAAEDGAAEGHGGAENVGGAENNARTGRTKTLRGTANYD